MESEDELESEVEHLKLTLEKRREMSGLIQIAKDRIEDYNHSLEWSSDTTSAGVQQMQKAKETTANYNVLPEEEESVHH